MFGLAATENLGVMTTSPSSSRSVRRSLTQGRPRLAPGVALLAVTASLVFFTTGVGMFEGRASTPRG